MAESESIKEIVNQMAMQAATVVMVVFRDADVKPQPNPTGSQREPQTKAQLTSTCEAFIQYECSEQVCQ